MSDCVEDEFGTPEQRVACGAAELDGKRPGWASLIDVDVLDMESQGACVLGQLARHEKDAFVRTYFALAVRLSTPASVAPYTIKHGFDLYKNHCVSCDCCERLRVAWVTQIRSRIIT